MISAKFCDSGARSEPSGAEGMKQIVFTAFGPLCGVLEAPSFRRASQPRSVGGRPRVSFDFKLRNCSIHTIQVLGDR